jgi:antitoxin YefM
MTISEARANLAAVLDTATEDLEEVIITRAGHEPAVVISLREYEALKETAYLLGNPANARHLERSIAEHRGGQAVPHDLVEDDEPEPKPEPAASKRVTPKPAKGKAARKPGGGK